MITKYKPRLYRIMESCEGVEDVLLLGTYMHVAPAKKAAKKLKKEYPNNTYKVVKTKYTTVCKI